MHLQNWSLPLPFPSFLCPPHIPSPLRPNDPQKFLGFRPGPVSRVCRVALVPLEPRSRSGNHLPRRCWSLWVETWRETLKTGDTREWYFLSIYIILLVRFTQGCWMGCWGLLELSLIVIMDHETSFPTFSTSKSSISLATCLKPWDLDCSLQVSPKTLFADLFQARYKCNAHGGAQSYRVGDFQRHVHSIEASQR